MDNDGVSLNSVPHPRVTPWWRRWWMRLYWFFISPSLSADSLEETEIEMRLSVRTGGLLNSVGYPVDDKDTESEIQAKGLNAPRVTLEHIESLIAVEAYTTGECFGVWRYDASSDEERQRLLAELELITVCILILRNGFKVIGDSACVSRENFDAELGRKIARQKAVDQIWALEGYLLKEKLHAAKQAQ